MSEWETRRAFEKSKGHLFRSVDLKPEIRMSKSETNSRKKSEMEKSRDDVPPSDFRLSHHPKIRSGLAARERKERKLSLQASFTPRAITLENVATLFSLRSLRFFAATSTADLVPFGFRIFFPSATDIKAHSPNPLRRFRRFHRMSRALDL